MHFSAVPVWEHFLVSTEDSKEVLATALKTSHWHLAFILSSHEFSRNENCLGDTSLLKV